MSKELIEEELEQDCPECEGSGEVPLGIFLPFMFGWKKPCEECNGTGKEKK